MQNYQERVERVESVLGATAKPVDVQFMGLWDTVEALVWPDYSENTSNPNPRCADQLCNVKTVAHALSIDDNRARILTPILFQADHLVEQCRDKTLKDVVDEVWFSGAHSNVGGGNAGTHISGVSLNWMLRKIAPYNLVPPKAGVFLDIMGLT